MSHSFMELYILSQDKNAGPQTVTKPSFLFYLKAALNYSITLKSCM